MPPEQTTTVWEVTFDGYWWRVLHRGQELFRLAATEEDLAILGKHRVESIRVEPRFPGPSVLREFTRSR